MQSACSVYPLRVIPAAGGGCGAWQAAVIRLMNAPKSKMRKIEKAQRNETRRDKTQSESNKKNDENEAEAEDEAQWQQQA